MNDFNPITPTLALALCMTAASTASSDESIRIDSVVLEVVEQVDVPALDAGVLESLLVREGQMVSAGEALAELESEETRLVLERAEIAWDVARREAESDINVRFAKASLEVARAELRRVTDSVEEYPKAVSQSEIDRLRLTVNRHELEIEQTTLQFDLARMDAKLKENAVRMVKLHLERRMIRAPISGIVARVYRRGGEWVEPGGQIVHLLRMDRLRVEGFLEVSRLDGNLVGREVILALDLPSAPGAAFPGRVVYVSREVDPINGQVRVWAEVENADLKLRPGLTGRLMIQPAKVPSDD
jgi:membrane fusion protein, multidrug efflux system